MSLLTAGKQISVGGDKAYGRGLFIADPEEVERKARKQAEYQQQLRIQMDEDRRRKQQVKRKEQEEDMRLEQKIKEDMKKENQKKPDKPAPKNDKNFTLPAAKSQVFNNEASKVDYKEITKEEQSNYKFNFHVNTDPDRIQNNPYLPRHFNLIQAEEERFFQESSNQKLRVMNQVLDEKMNEVFKKIKMSQDLEIDKQIEIIRKKIASSNGTYDSQNPKYQQFDGQISYFYKVPKKMPVYQSRAAPKNLMYDTSSYTKRKQNIVKEYNPVTQTKMDVSRQLMSRDSRNSGDQRMWGAKKGKGNYLGNRQAMDYQINSIMGKIDNLLEEPQHE